MPFHRKKKFFSYLTGILLSACMLVQASFFVSAAPAEEELEQATLQRRQLAIQSNENAYWPKGPVVSAQAAILMEAETGTILYAKNIDEKLYPASTTKMLTCLIAADACSMDEIVNVSYAAVEAVPSDGSNMGIDGGEALTMEECLYGIMVASANEVANAVAEHVAGSMDEFAELMNAKAAELGCKNSHFVNCNGLYNDNHYTSAYDLALIARAYFNNDVLKRIGNTPSYHFLPTATQPDDFYKTNKHELINGKMLYEGIIGGKTGYTDEARQTLVTGCEQNGMRLICVVLMEESPFQFEDTVALFDYGYQNFTKANISDNDTRYIIDNSSFLHTGSDIFGNSSSILSISREDYVVIPNMSRFEDLTPVIDYNAPGLKENEIARITYYYHDTLIGAGTLIFSTDNIYSYQFSPHDDNQEISGRPDNVIFINVKLMLFVICVLAAVTIFFLILHAIIFSRQDYRHQRRRRKKERRDRRAVRKARRHARRR